MPGGQPHPAVKRKEIDGLQHKYCPGCREYLPLEKFPKHRRRIDGLHCYCRPCNRRMQAKDRRQDWHKEMRRRYRTSSGGSAAYNRYYEANGHKKATQTAVMQAIRRGDLIKPAKCEECGKRRRLDGHHDDYAKPLDVRWLCRWCHSEWHRLNGEAANATARS